MQKYQDFAMNALSQISVSEQAKQPLKTLAENLLTRQN
jgi:geranylgeranyl pyrophosphate synthase